MGKAGLNIQKSKFNKWHVIVTSVSVLLVLAGLYMAFLIFSPNLAQVPGMKNATSGSEKLAILNHNYLEIPKLNLFLRVGMEQKDLDYGVWHKLSDRSNPEKGGNIILTGHRFSIALTAGDTVKKSPFYHIEKLEPGDKLIYNYNDKKYAYEVKSMKEVKPTAIEVEDNTDFEQLTLYTCTLGGAADGRMVLTALPVDRDKKDEK